MRVNQSPHIPEKVDTLMLQLARANKSLESVFQTLTDSCQSVLCSVHLQVAHRSSLASPALTPGSRSLPNHGAAALRTDVAVSV